MAFRKDVFCSKSFDHRFWQKLPKKLSKHLRIMMKLCHAAWKSEQKHMSSAILVLAPPRPFLWGPRISERNVSNWKRRKFHRKIWNLENKLLLVSINFSPKTSHSCLKKEGTLCFLGRWKELMSGVGLKEAKKLFKISWTFKTSSMAHTRSNYRDLTQPGPPKM